MRTVFDKVDKAFGIATKTIVILIIVATLCWLAFNVYLPYLVGDYQMKTDYYKSKNK